MEWLEEVKRLLNQSLVPVSQELNKLDWKISLSEDRKRLAEHSSAMANQSGGGYFVFGISPLGEKVGLDQESITDIIAHMGNVVREGLEPVCRMDHRILEDYSAEKNKVVLLAIRIEESPEKPVHLRGQPLEKSFIRSGGQTRKMDGSEIRHALLSTKSQRLEELPIHSSNPQEVLQSIDLKPVCERLNIPYPQDPKRLEETLIDLRFAVRVGQIVQPTFLGIIVACRDFAQIQGCERFAIRITQYRGLHKLFALKEQIYSQGYVHSFDRIIEDVINILPHSEVIEKATRKQLPLYPMVALRELIANAAIHRDYSRTDSYVHIEIYDDRIEITSPGSLLPDMDVDRLINQQPRARNEILADRMRGLGFCEERGSGLDRATFALEDYGLPAARFINQPDCFKAVLYAPKEYKKMTQEERLRTVYQHTCLHYEMQQDVTNASLRGRLKLAQSQSQLVSKLIKQGIAAHLIKIANPGTSPRYIRYIPYWA